MDTPNFNAMNSIIRGFVITTLIIIILLVIALVKSYGQTKIDSTVCKSDEVVRILGKKTVQIDCDTTYLLPKSVFRKYTRFAEFVKNGQLSQLIGGYEQMINTQQDHYQTLLSETKQMYQISSFALTNFKVELADIKGKFEQALTGLENVQYSLHQAETLINKTKKGLFWKIFIPSAAAFAFGVFIAK